MRYCVSALCMLSTSGGKCCCHMKGCWQCVILTGFQDSCLWSFGPESLDLPAAGHQRVDEMA